MKHCYRTFSLLIFGLLNCICSPNRVALGEADILNAQSPHGGSPQSCAEPYHYLGELSRGEYYCPTNQAFYGIDDPSGPKFPASGIRVRGACCPLPAPDILTDKFSFEPEFCPTDSIATGSVERTENGVKLSFLRCTKINKARYQLGKVVPGRYWGTGYSGWRYLDVLRFQTFSWDEIPAGMRLAQGRQSKAIWDRDGCVGYPWGSLLTGKENKYCSGFHFRQLQFRGQVGDPVQGMPVQMFPPDFSYRPD